MKLEHINYILEVCKTNSIRQASKNLFITQPNLSNSIKNLEAELGFTIFKRSRNGVELTKEGLEFIKYAKNISTNLSSIGKINKSIKQKELVSFNITSQLFSYTLDTFYEYHLDFLDSNTNFKLDYSNCLDTINNVYNKTSDLGLIYIHNDNDRSWYSHFYSHNIDFYPIADAHLFLCVGPNHELANCDNVSLEDLYDYTLLLFDNYGDSPLYKTLVKDIEFDKFKNKITIYDYYSYFDTIRNKNVVSFVPIFDKFTSKSFTKNNLSLKSIPFDNMPSFTFGYIKLNSLTLSQLHLNFIDKLRTRIGI